MKNDLELFRFNTAKNQLTSGIKVRAGARENSIGGFIFMDEVAYLKITIKAIAEGGKANLSLIAYLSEQWKIPRNNIDILQGLNSNYKIVTIKNIEKEYLGKLLFT